METFVTEDDVENSIRQMEVAAVNFATRFINDANVRMLYNERTRRMSNELRTAYRTGGLTPKQAAMTATEMRNEIMAFARSRTSDLGNAKAIKLKARGIDFDALLDKNAQRQFGKAFSELTEAEALSIYKYIVDSAGRPNARVNTRAANLGKVGRALWVLTICIAVYNISHSQNKVKAAGREVANVGGGFAGGAAGGAVAGIWFGPIGVGVGIVVGGVLGAIMADQVYIELAGPDGEFARNFIPRFTNLVSTNEKKMAEALVSECRYELDKVMAVFIELNDKYSTDADDVAAHYVNTVRHGNYPVTQQALKIHTALKQYLIQTMESGWTSSEEKEAIRYLKSV
ncbi:hypothetical protein [Thaumasiovibrio subtropicus]|uniref:hypothetical protein n=1 Tax=Thaumasiovibrio subtropicus TaxID=1891207 RepID=UPI000B35838E|nr:hypothetical protein [Thaumasiovibrio subtropicus]